MIADFDTLLAGLSAPTFAVLGNHDQLVDARAVEHTLTQMARGWNLRTAQTPHAGCRRGGGALDLRLNIEPRSS